MPLPSRRTDRPAPDRRSAVTAVPQAVAARWRAWSLIALAIVTAGCSSAAAGEGRALPAPVQLPTFAEPSASPVTSPQPSPSDLPSPSAAASPSPTVVPPTPRPTVIVVRPTPIVIDDDDESDDDEPDDPDDDPDDPDDDEPDDDEPDDD